MSALRRFKPYAAYKDSGVDWLGEIPAHWAVKRLRTTVGSCQNGVWGEEPDGVHDIACVRVADFDRVAFRVDVSELTIRSIEPGVAAARRLRRADLLLEKSGGGESQPVGTVVIYDHELPAVCSNFVARVQISTGNNARFLTYLHACLYALRLNTRHIKQSTGIQNLDSSSYLGEPVGLAPEPEQQAIAAFLDRETGRIDALVAKNQRLIGLLQERREALITRAVTKGLDPSVPLKDSGVDWLGQIPADWHCLSLKRVAWIRYGLGEPPQLLADGLPFVRATNVAKGRIVETDLQFVDPGDVPWNRSPGLRAGDIIVVRSGAYTGDSAIVSPEYDGGIAGYDMVVSVQGAVSEFVAWALLSRYVLEAQIELDSLRAAQPHLNAEQLGAVVLAVPPEVEQRSIAAFLSRETARIDALIAKVREAIGRLKELRTALISAAVTGKIDVRGVAA